MKKVIMLAALASLTLALGGCIRGQSVDAGNVGIKIDRFGANAGVQNEVLSTGWHNLGWGEKIVEYPTITRTYQWTAANDGSNKDANEEFSFADNSGNIMHGDIAIKMSVERGRVPWLYNHYKLSFNDLLDQQIRPYVRNALNARTSTMSLDQIRTGYIQALEQAKADVQKRFAPEGIQVEDLYWINPIRYSSSVQTSIDARAKADADTATAQTKVAQAEAEARVKIANAQGDAEATRIRGEAFRQNPQILQEQWIAKWNGELPQYVGGNNQPVMMFTPNQRQQ